MLLILCGLPGSGKSTLGRRVAECSDLPFFDTDQMVEKRFGEGVSCRELFIQQGERVFREYEQAVVEQLLDKDKGVVATGGGMLMNPLCAEPLRRLGKVVYLRASLDFVYANAIQKGIPPYLDLTNPRRAFELMAQSRLPIYERFADRVIDVESCTMESLVKIIGKSNGW